LRPEIEQLYKDSDGCLYFYNFKQLTMEEALEAVDEMRINANWCNNYMPIGVHVNERDVSEYLIVDKQGTVIAWEVDEGVLEKIADSLQVFLSKFVEEAITKKSLTYQGKGIGYRK
jgi:hypothetical protein